MRRDRAPSPAETSDIHASELVSKIEELYDDMHEVEEAWSLIDCEVRSLLGDEHVEQVLALTEAEDDPEDPASYNRDDRAYRRWASAYKQDLRESITSTVVHAKWEAQMLLWGDDDVKATAQAWMQAPPPYDDPYDIHFLTSPNG